MFKKVLRNVKKYLDYMVIWVLNFNFIFFWEDRHPVIKIIYIIGILAIILSAIIILFVRDKRVKSEFLNSCLETRNAFKLCHIIRYRAYLSGDSSKAEVLDRTMRMNQDDMLANFKYAMENIKFTKKQKELLQEAIDDTEYMINNIRPK